MNKNESAIFSAISYSYIRFIEEYLNVLKNPITTSLPYLDEETLHLLDEMKTLFLSLPSLIGAEELFKQQYVDTLLTFKNTLEKKYRSLHAYKRELQHLTSWFNLTHATDHTTFEDFELTEEDALQMDFDKLSQDCTAFIFSEQTLSLRQERACLLLPFIPMRMTKDSFLAYAEKSIHEISIEDTTESATLLFSVLRQLLDGTLYSAYGKDFGDFAISLSDLKATTDPDAFFESAELLNETLDSSSLLIHNLYRMLCTFSNLLIFDRLTFEALTDLHVSFYDLYCSLQNILTNHLDKEILLETLPDRVKEIKESVEKIYLKSTLQKEIDPLLALIRTYLMMDVSLLFGFDTDKHGVYNRDVQLLFKDFFAELKEYLGSKLPIERKLRMQYFISVIPFIMNEKTFTAYITQGFKNVANPKRNLFTAMFLSNALEENGFFETPNKN